MFKPQKKRNKYNARKVHVCTEGHVMQDPKRCYCGARRAMVFDSQKEWDRWVDLKVLERKGLITELERQVRFPLLASGLVSGSRPIKIRSKGYPNGRASSYVADFTYKENGLLVIEDVKGKDTDISRIKRAIVEANRDTEVRIT